MLKQFLQYFDESADFNYKLADLLTHLGRYKNALPYAYRALELDKDFEDAYDLVGNIFFEIGDYDNSLDAYKEIVRLRPKDAMAHYNLGCAYLALRDTGRAKASWKRVLALDLSTPAPEEPKKEAGDDLNQSITVRKNPPAYMAHMALGYLYKRSGRPEQAMSEFKKAVYLVESDPEPYFEIGNIHLDRREFEQAVLYLEKYLYFGGEREEEAKELLASLKRK
jgi:tetratricopeptide (TPR) repeat protein